MIRRIVLHAEPADPGHGVHTLLKCHEPAVHGLESGTVMRAPPIIWASAPGGLIVTFAASLFGTNNSVQTFMCSEEPRRNGAFLLVIAMLEMTDFFQTQAQECRRLAAQATGKNDREYWLRLAQRWEWLVQQNRSAEVEAIRPRKPARSVLEKRLAKRQAA